MLRLLPRNPDKICMKTIMTINTHIRGLFNIWIINHMYKVIFKYILISWNYADQDS